MKIVQTFWSAGKSPLVESYGWLNAEYNILSWAFSCLCLTKLFPDVELYTDMEGREILINQLQLPYTKVHVVLGADFCLPHHWALAKINTYSLQTAPFLHIDGDVYITKRLEHHLLTASLVAQNREIGTGYYRDMIDYILKYPQISIPKYIKSSLQNDTIASYNMGVFGGSDLTFIRRYCQEAFRFIQTNNMNDKKLPYSGVECNILFEQMLFASMADNEKRNVACVINRAIRDEGYRAVEFCDIIRYAQKSFFHVLGGHKRDRDVCERLRKAMLDKYPSYALKIMSMFPENHSRLQIIPENVRLYFPVEHCLAQYEDFVGEAEISWRSLPFADMYHTERRVSNYHAVFDRCVEQVGIEKCRVVKNPNMRVFSVPRDWPSRAVEVVARKTKAGIRKMGFSVVVIPSLYDDGVKEVPIGDLGLNVLELVGDEGVDMGSLESQLLLCFNGFSEETIKQLIYKEMEYLMYHGVILICGDYE